MSKVLALVLALVLPQPPRGVVPRGEVGPSEGPGAFLYADGSIHDFDITLGEADAEALGRGEPDVHATLAYRGVTWDVGLRLKGSSTYQDLDGKPSLKVDFEQWGKGRTLLGVRRLTLNAMVFDGSMLREHVAYRLYTAMGVPAPRHGYARVRINGEPYGLYGIVETLDEQWLRRLFPRDSEGNLYDSRFTLADLTPLGRAYFTLEEGDPAAADADLDALYGAVGRGDILEVLEERFDAEAVLSMWAVELVLATWDGYCRNANNYLLYHATRADRWYFVPWGQDTTLSGGGTLYAGITGRLAAACVADRDCRAALEAQVRRALDTWEALDLAEYAAETWGFIEAACEADPRRPDRCDPDGLFEELAERPGRIRDELGP